MKQIVNLVERTLGVLIEKNQAKPRRGDFAEIYADASKAIKLLEWRAEKTLEESIKALATWYQRRPHGF